MDKKKLDALMESLYDTDDIALNFKGLLYGDPGARKTTTAAMIANRISRNPNGYTIILVADPDGWQSLLNHPELEFGHRIRPMKYKGVSQLEALAEALDEELPQFVNVETLILDTLSNIASLDLDTVQKEKMKVKGDKWNFEDDMWGVYNQNSLRIKNAVLKLYLSPINIIATAHSREKLYPATGRTKTLPKFSPEIFAAVNSYMSMIAYMTANEAGVDSDGSVKYKTKVQYHPTASIVAKTRIGGLPAAEDNPDIPRIVDEWLIKGGKLLGHQEAEEEIPEEEGLNPPAAIKVTSDTSLEDFGLD
jgi:hypothetical protein